MTSKKNGVVRFADHAVSGFDSGAKPKRSFLGKAFRLVTGLFIVDFLRGNNSNGIEETGIRIGDKGNIFSRLTLGVMRRKFLGMAATMREYKNTGEPKRALRITPSDPKVNLPGYVAYNSDENGGRSLIVRPKAVFGLDADVGVSMSLRNAFKLPSLTGALPHRMAKLTGGGVAYVGAPGGVTVMNLKAGERYKVDASHVIAYSCENVSMELVTDSFTVNTRNFFNKASNAIFKTDYDTDKIVTMVAEGPGIIIAGREPWKDPTAQIEIDKIAAVKKTEKKKASDQALKMSAKGGQVPKAA